MQVPAFPAPLDTVAPILEHLMQIRWQIHAHQIHTRLQVRRPVVLTLAQEDNVQLVLAVVVRPRHSPVQPAASLTSVKIIAAPVRPVPFQLPVLEAARPVSLEPILAQAHRPVPLLLRAPGLVLERVPIFETAQATFQVARRRPLHSAPRDTAAPILLMSLYHVPRVQPRRPVPRAARIVILDTMPLLGRQPARSAPRARAAPPQQRIQHPAPQDNILKLARRYVEHVLLEPTLQEMSRAVVLAHLEPILLQVLRLVV